MKVDVKIRQMIYRNIYIRHIVMIIYTFLTWSCLLWLDEIIFNHILQGYLIRTQACPVSIGQLLMVWKSKHQTVQNNKVKNEKWEKVWAHFVGHTVYESIYCDLIRLKRPLMKLYHLSPISTKNINCYSYQVNGCIMVFLRLFTLIKPMSLYFFLSETIL